MLTAWHSISYQVHLINRIHDMSFDPTVRLLQHHRNHSPNRSRNLCLVLGLRPSQCLRHTRRNQCLRFRSRLVLSLSRSRNRSLSRSHNRGLSLSLNIGHSRSLNGSHSQSLVLGLRLRPSLLHTRLNSISLSIHRSHSNHNHSHHTCVSHLHLLPSPLSLLSRLHSPCST